MKEIEIILNHDELDWLDEGNGFCSLDDLPRKDYNDISWSVKEKLKVLYTNEAKFRNEYKIKLTNQEINEIQQILVDMIIESYRWILDNEPLKDLEFLENETIPLNNKILKKLGKSILTVKSIKKTIELSKDKDFYIYDYKF